MRALRTSRMVATGMRRGYGSAASTGQVHQRRLKNVMCGIDGSDPSWAALETSLDYVQPTRDKLFLLAVPELPHGFIPNSTTQGDLLPLIETANELCDERLSEAEHRVRTRYPMIDVTMIRSEWVDHPRTALKDEVNSRDIDLVVLGSVGHNLVHQIIVGSTTSFALENVNADVLAVKYPRKDKQKK